MRAVRRASRLALPHRRRIPYELRCLTCVTGMSDGEFPFPEPLVDGIIREEWACGSCPIGSSLRDLNSVSEYSAL